MLTKQTNNKIDNEPVDQNVSTCGLLPLENVTLYPTLSSSVFSFLSPPLFLPFNLNKMLTCHVAGTVLGAGDIVTIQSRRPWPVQLTGQRRETGDKWSPATRSRADSILEATEGHGVEKSRGGEQL